MHKCVYLRGHIAMVTSIHRYRHTWHSRCWHAKWEPRSIAWSVQVYWTAVVSGRILMCRILCDEEIG